MVNARKQQNNAFLANPRTLPHPNTPPPSHYPFSTDGDGKHILYKKLLKDLIAKVEVVRDSHKLLLSPYREFERHFGGKTVLAGLRLKKQLMVVSKITFEVSNLF
jgi:hypothetical protein